MLSEVVEFRVPCSDRIGEEEFVATLRWETGQNHGLNPRKIADIWDKARRFDVLFSDETRGKLEPFLDVLVAPNAAWFEICRGGEIVGLAYFSHIHPGIEAQGHFTFWDSVASGREPLLLFVTEWIMDRYQLHRLTAQIPAYQAGVIRFATRNLGFVREGEKREAVRYKERWWGMVVLGLTKEELDEKIRTLF